MTEGQWLVRHGLSMSLALQAVIVLVDVVLGADVAISGTYAIPAVLAATIISVRRTALVGLLAVTLALWSGVWNADFATQSWTVRLVLTVILSAIAVLSASMRIEREQGLREMTVIAETAQRAVLRSMPSSVGLVGFAARYVSATREALIGGDLYEVAATPYGVRVIVGDVRGKGLEAVQLAATVLGAFRRAAFIQPSLTDIATDLDGVVTAVAGEEDFVTALLAEFHDDHTVTLVNCGHHPPLLVNGTGTAELVQTGEPVPPLGLRPTPLPTTTQLPSGARLLIYTDGLIETRDHRGVFFPLAEHAAALGHGSLDEALDRLTQRLIEYAGHQVKDDMALVLAERRSA